MIYRICTWVWSTFFTSRYLPLSKQNKNWTLARKMGYVDMSGYILTCSLKKIPYFTGYGYSVYKKGVRDWHAISRLVPGIVQSHVNECLHRQYLCTVWSLVRAKTHSWQAIWIKPFWFGQLQSLTVRTWTVLSQWWVPALYLLFHRGNHSSHSGYKVMQTSHIKEKL